VKGDEVDTELEDDLSLVLQHGADLHVLHETEKILKQAARSQEQLEEGRRLLRLAAGLAIKTPPKKNPKKPTKNGFFVFFKFLIFYENNTNFSL
jgi:hypothetical protein